jgi:hypothetical protein
MRTRRVLAFGIASFMITGLLLTGCGKKEPEPTASGYYEGPMKPKSESSTKTDDQSNPTGTGNSGTR